MKVLLTWVSGWLGIGTSEPPRMTTENLEVAWACVHAAKPMLSHGVFPGRTGLATGVFSVVLDCQKPIHVAGLSKIPIPIGLKPTPLPQKSSSGRVSPEVARLQRSYRKLLELGLHEEAAEIAEQLRLPSVEIIPAVAVVPNRGSDESHQRNQHQVFFRGGPSLRLHSEHPQNWNDARSVHLSCQFHGESLAQFLRYIHQQTNLTIHVSGEDIDHAKMYFQCIDQPLETVLARALPSRGWDFTIRDGELIVTKPLLTSIRDSGVPIVR